MGNQAIEHDCNGIHGHFQKYAIARSVHVHTLRIRAGRRLQDPGLMLFDFDYLVGNSNFITDIFVVYETNPESLAYGRPIGGILEDRAYISAIFALGLNSGAYQCETIRGAIAAIPSGQMEAGRSIGLNYMQSMRLVVMPQAVRICIPPLR
ncbi:MAG: hypothetical protein Ct9H90mP24_5550 [Methanobacteriota archaeon]|nr:MAG: hypothetical protein Ct9H90mP24_5550 [Euryarchaeota archaeon]